MGKPPRPPITDIRIEVLSTKHPARGRDDFTHEPIAAKPERVQPTDHREVRAQAKARNARMVLNLIPSLAEPRAVAPAKPGYITKIIMVNGKPMAQLVQSKLPWRR